MKTWTTIRWGLEHRSVQGGIEPMRLKSHQALNFRMKCNLSSCFLPDFGTVIVNWKINFSNWMIRQYRERLELDRKGEKKIRGDWGSKHTIGGRWVKRQHLGKGRGFG